MQYINILTKEYPISEEQIRNVYPNTSFPIQFIPPEDYAGVTPTVKPNHDPKLQYAVEDSPVLTYGQYYQSWQLVDYTPEEVAINIENARLVAIPTSVSPRQIRQALTRTNLRSAVETAVASADQDTKDWWEFATEVERNHPQVLSMGLLLNVSSLELDNLWTLAASL